MRSGNASQDPRFDPEELFEILVEGENVHRVLAAMREFVRHGDGPLFERAVAVYVRSARSRKEPIETVLGSLERLADEVESAGTPGFAQRDTPLRSRILRGVLLAFFGADVVDREASARQGRVEDRRVGQGELPPKA